MKCFVRKHLQLIATNYACSHINRLVGQKLRFKNVFQTHTTYTESEPTK